MNQKIVVASNFLMGDYQHFEKQIEVSPQWVYKKPYDFKIYPKFSNPYWYHPDHLGSSSYITNTRGIITQHMEYLPFGETLVEEHLNSNNSPYKFNAKQLDEETGWYYYGARYYNPKWSFFISVDTLAEIMPSWSPYTYTFNNPVRYTDPTGMVPENGGNCPEGDCWDGGTIELDTVVIKHSSSGVSKDRTWSTETEAYGASITPSEYQAAYPEFAGMSDGQMQDHWNENHRGDHVEWADQQRADQQAERLMRKLWFFTVHF